MLPKKQRLNRVQFSEVFGKGTSVHGKVFSFRFYRGGNINEVRLSVVVSKKQAHGAIVRGRIRRRCYSILKKLLSEITIPFHGIVFVRTDLSSHSPLLLERELQGLLSRAGLLGDG